MEPTGASGLCLHLLLAGLSAFYSYLRLSSQYFLQLPHEYKFLTPFPFVAYYSHISATHLESRLSRVVLLKLSAALSSMVLLFIFDWRYFLALVLYVLNNWSLANSAFWV